MEYISYYNSPLGTLTLTSDGSALTGLRFDFRRCCGGTSPADEESWNLPVFRQTEQWLNVYFSGRPPEFTPPLSLRGTAFQRSVWEAIRRIPFGQTTTYGEIARRLAGPGRRVSAQAVGGAARRNPILLIIPCHRVIGANGSLTGYAAGIDRKRILLQIENGNLPAWRRPELFPEEYGKDGFPDA